MRENNLFTYVLYAALIGLVALAGYKYWQRIQEEKALNSDINAAEQQKFSELGYEPQDTLGTAYVEEQAAREVPYIPPGGNSADGIEDEPTAAPSSAKKSSGTTAPAASTKVVTTPKGVAATPADTRVDELAMPDGRYRVIAGSFTRMDRAREHMERLVKMGYQEAEVGHFNRGKYGVVIVKRTDDLNEANRIVDRLEAKGIDAAVVDSNRKN